MVRRGAEEMVILSKSLIKIRMRLPPPAKYTAGCRLEIKGLAAEG
jgi:hypothetical protein